MPSTALPVAPHARPDHLTRSHRPSLAHVPALDGLRGAAVAAVVLFHAGHLSGGFLGVDLFFVLSGFLITSLLLVERDAAGSISLRGFWGRRFRRLLPALLLMLVAVSIYAGVAVDVTELGAFRRDALGTLGYVANWVSISAGGDYWATYASPSPLEHTWSLAIEEQFYVVWPLVVATALALGRGRRYWIWAATLGGIVASVVSLQVLHVTGGDTNRAYYGTDTRIAAILYGAVVALWASGREREEHAGLERALRVLAVPAVAVLAVAWVRAAGTSPSLYAWGFPLLGVSAAVVIAAVTGTRRTLLGRVLSWGPLRHLGLISYGLYLWHWPVYVVLDEARTGLSGWALTSLRIAVSVGCAEVSLLALERPIRLRRWPVVRWPAALGSMAVTAIVALVVTIPMADRLDESGTALPAASTSLATDGRPRVLMVGDSGASLLTDGIALAGAELGVEVVGRGTVGCGIARESNGVLASDGTFLADPAGCDDWPTRWRSEVDALQPDAALLVLAWGGIGDREVGGELRHPCDPAFDRYYRTEVDAALDALRGAPLVAVATVPYITTARDHDDRVDCLNRIYAASVAERDGAALVDLGQWTCPAAQCMEEYDGVELRPDGVHFEGWGGLQAGRWLVNRLLDRLQLPPARLPEQILLVGDSQATILAERFTTADEFGAGVRSATRIGCGTTAGYAADGDRIFDESDCSDTADRWVTAAEEMRAQAVVVLTGAWEVLDHVVDDRRYEFGTSEWDDLVRDGLLHTLRPLADRHLYVLTAPCFAATSQGPLSAPTRADPERVVRFNELLEDVAGDLGATVLQYDDYVCPAGATASPTDPLRYDGVHLSEDGAVTVWRWLVEQVSSDAR